MLRKILNFINSIRQIERTPTTLVILACPFLLVFIILVLIVHIFDEQSGSVVSNDQACAKIGAKMLHHRGSVVDAAIATMFCQGVMLPNRAGIGGGFTAILSAGGIVETMIATPVVPKYFANNTSIDDIIDKAPKAAGVPGELLGYWKMHRKYGLLPWRKLLEPTIKLCEEGIPKTEWFASDIHRTQSQLFRNKGMRQLYFQLMNDVDEKRFKFRTLAKTLRAIAKHGPKAFYHGRIGRRLIKDLQSEGGVMTMEDLSNYTISWGEPIIFMLPYQKRAFTTGLPSMGPIVALALNIMKSCKLGAMPIFWHRTIEAMKHAMGWSYSLADVGTDFNSAFAKKVRETQTKMQDMRLAVELRRKIKDDRIFRDPSYYGVKYSATAQAGTSNICILAPNGHAIVLSSSLMWSSGSFFYSNRTGIILNTQLRSFVPRNRSSLLPSAPAQIMRAGERAISPHAPTIVMDRVKDEVKFAVGATGGSLIPSQVITALIYFCVLHENSYKAISSEFFHPDPESQDVLVSEPTGDTHVGKDVTDYLEKVGHNLSYSHKGNPYATRNCIAHEHMKPDARSHEHEGGGTEIVSPDHVFYTFELYSLTGMALLLIWWLIHEIIRLESPFESDSIFPLDEQHLASSQP